MEKKATATNSFECKFAADIDCSTVLYFIFHTWPLRDVC